MRFNLHFNSTPKQELSRLSRLSWRRLSGSCSPSYSMDVGLDMRRRRVVHHCSDLRDVDPARNNVRTSGHESQQILRILRATSYPLRPLSYPWAVRNLLTMWRHRVGFHWGSHTPGIWPFRWWSVSATFRAPSASVWMRILRCTRATNPTAESQEHHPAKAPAGKVTGNPGGYFESTESSVMRNGLWAWLKDIQRLYQSELAKWV
jgi:hypothetical protein